MPGWRVSLRDALGIFAASRILVLVTLVLSDRAPHSYIYDWDAGFYRTLAIEGYRAVGVPQTDAAKPAFFPLVPAVERAGSWLGGEPAWWGAAFATLCAAVALVLLHRSTTRRFGPRAAPLAVAAVAFFPFSYVLSTGYTEAPFLLFSLAAYELATLRRPLAAAASGFVAGLSRPAGPLLAAGLAWDAWRRPERRAAALAAALGAVAGTAVFFAYLYHVRGDALASLHAQREGWHRSVSPLGAPGDLASYVWQAFSRPRATYLVYLAGVPLCVVGLWVLWRARVRDGAFVFALASLVVPLATGSAMSLPRFAMATFPYAWAAGIGLERLPPRWRRATLAASAVGLVLCIWASYWEAGKLAP